MLSRKFGRTGWQVSEIGYGMWGMGGWTGSDDQESLRALDRAIELGCTFFDTAWVYGQGRSEKLLGAALKSHPGTKLVVATKIPPRNMQWPARDTYRIGETYPPDHIRAFTEKSLDNLGVDVIDLQQFHVWSDTWAEDDGWKRAVDDLRTSGLVRAIGISINRWEPTNVIRALDTGLIDCVQVVHNIFDQAPEDELFPYCRQHDIAIIAQPYRNADAGLALAGRRLSESLLHGRDAAGNACARRAPRTAGSRRHGSARAGAQVHPRAPRGEHRHSRHAPAGARRAQSRGQRRGAAAAAADGGAARPPVGPGFARAKLEVSRTG